MDAERGEFDKSLAEVKAFLKERAARGIADENRLPAPLVCAVGEAYLQRLVRGDRYDIARQVCSLLAESNHPDEAVKNYFNHRLARFNMVGKPAPTSKEKTSTAGPCGLQTTKERSSSSISGPVGHRRASPTAPSSANSTTLTATRDLW